MAHGRFCVVVSMAPSERARAFGAPVEVDGGPIKPGELQTVEWRGKPVGVLRRTTDMLGSLRSHDDLLSDPQPSRPGQQPDYGQGDTEDQQSTFGARFRSSGN